MSVINLILIFIQHFITPIMKNFLIWGILITILALTHFASSAQQNNKTEIRKLEGMEAAAILKGDTIVLLQLLSPQIVVHNPENAIVKFDKIIERIRNGKIDYSSFERIIENIAFVENIAIVMGKEKLTP